jgi:hypothetical protein
LPEISDVNSWLQTASAGFPNLESGAQRAFSQAKPAMMCRAIGESDKSTHSQKRYKDTAS